MLPEIPPLPEAVTLLADDLVTELCDPTHIKRVHGRRTTYNAGCRGPLCLRADRMYNRDAYAQQRKEAGKPYRPSDLRRDDRDDELDAACAVYVTYSKAIEIHVRLTELYAELATNLAG